MNEAILLSPFRVVPVGTLTPAGAGTDRGGRCGWRRMRRWLLVAVTVFWGAAAWASSAANDMQAGKRLSENCAMCHGTGGNASNPAFPSLAGQSQGYLLEQLHAYRDGKRVCYGHPTMNVLAQHLSDQQMVELAAYFSKQSRRYPQGHAVGSIIGGHLYHFGRAQDQVGACEYCHGVHGSGHVAGHDQGFPTLRGLSEEYVRAALHEFRNGYRTGGHTHIMRHITAKLSEGDIDALSRYVSVIH